MPAEKRIDPDDGVAYTWEELSAFYKGKFKKKALEEYWENTCKPVKDKSFRRRGRTQKKDDKAVGDKSSDKKSDQKAKKTRKVVEIDPGYFLVDPGKQHPDPEKAKLGQKDPENPGDKDAQYIASRLPGFNFKDVPSFFDVGGICADPKALKLATDIFVERYYAMSPKPTSICGLDARGFIFGPLVAQRLRIPFFMMRKAGKLPGPVMECAYKTEYSDEILVIPCASVKPGDRVVIFDDLIATGGTTIAAANLIIQCGGVVAEVAVITAIAFFKGWQKFISSLPQLKDVPIFAIVEATNALCMPEGSTESFKVASGSDELKAIQEAMKDAKLGDVLVKEAGGKFSAKPVGPGFNTKYAESEG